VIDGLQTPGLPQAVSLCRGTVRMSARRHPGRSRFLQRLCSTAIAVLAASASATEPLDRAAVAEFMAQHLERYVSSEDVPGAVVAVVSGRNILFQVGYGLADIASDRPVHPAVALVRWAQRVANHALHALQRLFAGE